MNDSLRDHDRDHESRRRELFPDEGEISDAAAALVFARAMVECSYCRPFDAFELRPLLAAVEVRPTKTDAELGRCEHGALRAYCTAEHDDREVDALARAEARVESIMPGILALALACGWPDYREDLEMVLRARYGAKVEA